MKNRNDLAAQWISRGQKDALSARRELSFEDPVCETVCFHAQQAVEKYLKGYCVVHGISPPRIHDIGTLLQLAGKGDPDIPRDLREADDLTVFAVEIRYPEAPSIPTEEDARDAVAIMGKVESFLRIRLSTDLFSSHDFSK